MAVSDSCKAHNVDSPLRYSGFDSLLVHTISGNFGGSTTESRYLANSPLLTNLRGEVVSAIPAIPAVLGGNILNK